MEECVLSKGQVAAYISDRKDAFHKICKLNIIVRPLLLQNYHSSPNKT